MKKYLFFIFVAVIAMSCEKEEALVLSAKEQFELLPSPYRLSSINAQGGPVNFFKRNDNQGTILLYRDSTEIMDITKIAWTAGLGDILCVCGYGGSVLPGSTMMYLCEKSNSRLIVSPADSLLFHDVRIGSGLLCLEFVSQASYLSNLNSRNQLAYPENLRMYYGRYNISTSTLSMDK